MKEAFDKENKNQCISINPTATPYKGMNLN
jgi:hypothetical protein